MLKNLILIIRQDNYVLYNYKNKKVYAYSLVKSEDGFIKINLVAAKHGYGPIIHDMIMMHVYPLQVIADSSLTEAEKNVWKFYFEKRKDVSHQVLPKKKLRNITQQYLRYSYQFEPKNWFKDFIFFSEHIILVKKINTTRIINEGMVFFEKLFKNEKERWIESLRSTWLSFTRLLVLNNC